MSSPDGGYSSDDQVKGKFSESMMPGLSQCQWTENMPTMTDSKTKSDSRSGNSLGSGNASGSGTLKSKAKARVPRPMNAFMLWAKEERRRLAQQHPDLHNAELSKMLGKSWRAMTHIDRLPFTQEAYMLSKKHLHDHPDYKFTPRRRNQEKKMKQSNKGLMHLPEQAGPSGLSMDRRRCGESLDVRHPEAPYQHHTQMPQSSHCMMNPQASSVPHDYSWPTPGTSSVVMPGQQSYTFPTQEEFWVMPSCQMLPSCSYNTIHPSYQQSTTNILSRQMVQTEQMGKYESVQSMMGCQTPLQMYYNQMYMPNAGMHRPVAQSGWLPPLPEAQQLLSAEDLQLLDISEVDKAEFDQYLGGYMVAQEVAIDSHGQEQPVLSADNDLLCSVLSDASTAVYYYPSV
ncbi:transcription factor Sox-17-alpha-like [Hyperolius riggenbachi]|uniref:transcription factor Sox-17-alpha-like n=1 Tax=Hyperolius riggenbachi TaxID=752182 RepID=UPI0035A2A49C